MTDKTGVVRFKNEKEFRGKVLYSIKLEGDDELYRIGEDGDAVMVGGSTWDDLREGDTVKVRFSTDRKGNSVVEKIKVEDVGTGQASGKSGPPRGNSGGAKSGGVDWDAKDARITLLSVQDRAREYVRLLIENDALKLPAKTKTEERREVIQGIIDTEAARLYRQAYDVDGFLAEAGTHTDAPVDVPDDDDFEDDVAAAEDDF